MKNKALNRLICGLSTLLTVLPFCSFAFFSPPLKDTVTSSGYKIKTIIVDAGHGGRKTGAAGSYSLEKNVTLAIALKLQTALEKEMKNVNIVMTRTDDEDISLGQRSVIANKNKGNLFVSIHCNSLSDTHRREVVGHKHHKPVYRTVSVPDRSGKGVLILVYGLGRVGAQNEALRENADIYEDKDYKENYQGSDPNDPQSVIVLNAFKLKYRRQSIRLANLINDEFTQTDGRHSDGVKEQVVFVLDHTAMPSVLVETGFINNHADEDYLNSENGQNEIVASVVRALKNYKTEVEQVSP